MRVLGIETSCDETAAAVIDGQQILADVVFSQIPIHQKYGGVVPELASRSHIRRMLPVLQQAMAESGLTFADLDGIAVTRGPGLIGSLIVGLETAKSLAYAHRLPLVGVHHIEGHITAIFLQKPGAPTPTPRFPYLALAVSGGHTTLYRVDALSDYRVLGTTRDDAAGEAFDKVAKMLGLPYPGGVEVDRLAKKGDPGAIDFPRPMLKKGIDFSFSGIKTAVRYHLARHGLPNDEQALSDLAASFQEAVVDVLVYKTMQAARSEGLCNVVLAGGVAANSRLRTKMANAAAERGVEVFNTPVALCTDNAAMIAGIGAHYLAANDLFQAPCLTMNAFANLPISGSV